MERRTFVKSLAAAMAAAQVLPEVGEALEQQVERLRTAVSAADSDAKLWQRVRKEFALNPGFIHFNSGSTGAPPRAVIDALCHYTRLDETDPYVNAFPTQDAVRMTAAEFIGADLGEVTLTRNTTEGMNMIATGLHLKPGDEVLTTNHEHAGGMICWQYLAKFHGVKMRYMEIPNPVRDKTQILELVEKNITRRTRACSFSHIDTMTGMQMPIAEIAAITRRKDIVLVCDGAQAPGMLDVDVKALGVDAYASSSHKWILAPKGSGLLYIRKEMQERIRPINVFNPIGADDFAIYSASSGAWNVPHNIAHGVAMDFHNAIGRTRVEMRCRELSWLVREHLRKIPALTLMTPEQKELSSGMVTFEIDPAVKTAAEVYSTFRTEHNIALKQGLTVYPYVPQEHVKGPHANPNAIRISTHIFNDENEVERMAGIMRDMLA